MQTPESQRVRGSPGDGASPGQQSLPALCLCAAGAWSYKGGKHSAALRGRLAAEVQGAEFPRAGSGGTGRVESHGVMGSMSTSFGSQAGLGPWSSSFSFFICESR